MPNDIWLSLLANLAVVAIFVSVATHTYEWRLSWPPVLRALSLGLLFGGGSIALMMIPLTWSEGVHFDLRSAPLVLAAFFGGPVAGILAGVMAIAYRLYLGGVGAVPGAVTITLSVLVGITGWLLRRNSAIATRDVLILSTWSGLTPMAGILMLPEPVRTQAFTEGSIPIVSLVFLSTAISGLALLAERRRTEGIQENQTYRTIIDNLPDSLNVKDTAGVFIAANPATAELMGADSVSDLIGRTDFDFYKETTAETFQADERAAMYAGDPTQIEQEFRRPDGNLVWLQTLKVPLLGKNGQPIGLITHNRDLTDRVKLEQSLAQTRSRFETAVEQISDGLVMYDASGTLVFCNERYRSMFPLTASLRVPGANLKTILKASVDLGERVDVPGDGVAAWLADTMTLLHTARHTEIQLNDGRWYETRSNPMEGGGAIIVVSDITDRKSTEVDLRTLTEQLKLLAGTDALSGLKNRRAFDEILGSEVLRSRRTRTALSLILADVDRFKAYNDRYGHQAGDECLRKISDAISGVLQRPADVAARYGGEELAVILPETDSEGAAALAERMRAAVKSLGIVHEDSEEGVVTISLGVATYVAAQGQRRAVELIGRADAALYAAKDHGRDRVESWAGQSMTTISSRMAG